MLILPLCQDIFWKCFRISPLHSGINEQPIWSLTLVRFLSMLIITLIISTLKTLCSYASVPKNFDPNYVWVHVKSNCHSYSIFMSLPPSRLWSESINIFYWVGTTKDMLEFNMKFWDSRSLLWVCMASTTV